MRQHVHPVPAHLRIHAEGLQCHLEQAQVTELPLRAPASEGRRAAAGEPGGYRHRHRRGTPAEDHRRPFPLGMAEEGTKVRIHALRAGRGLDRRLTDLGLNVGSEIQVVHRQGGSLLVARGETRIAIGGGTAMKMMVIQA